MMKSQFGFLIPCIFVLGACDNQRADEIEQQLDQTQAELKSVTNTLEEVRRQNQANEEALKRAEQEIANLKTQATPKTSYVKSGESKSANQQTQPSKAGITLLVNGNNVGTFSSSSACEKAAKAVNQEANKEQAERMEHNRKVYAGEIGPSVIYGNAIRAKTQCLDLGQ